MANVAYTPVVILDGNQAPVNAANPLPVMAGTPPANTVIGNVGGITDIVEVTPTLTVAATYISGDYVGTSGVAIDFATAARINGGTGIIQSAVLVDYALQSVACELWLFDAAPTPPNDSAAWTISDANAKTCIGVIQFSTYFANALNSISSAVNVGIGFKAGAADRSIFGCLVTRGAPAYASGDVTVRLTILQD
jgi:hypothetical protein